MTLAMTIITAEHKAEREHARRRARLSAAVDAHVEATAQALGYGGAAQLASYVASGVDAWAREARSFVAWRDAVWQQGLASMASDDALTTEALLAALPGLDAFLTLAD